MHVTTDSLARATTHAPATFLDEARQVLRLGSPIAIAQLGLMSLHIVDTAVMGRVSVDDFAGVSIGRSIAYASFSLGLGLTSALEPLAAQAVGAGAVAQAYSAFRATLRVCFAAWLPTVALSFLLSWMLEPVGVAPDVAHRARWFLAGQAGTQLLFLVFNAEKIFLQAHHRTRPALLAALAANVVNFVVCNLLVRGDDALALVGLGPLGLPRLGALGAGLASSLASLVLALVLVPSVRAFRAEAPPEPVPVAAVMALGWPLGLQLLAETGIFSLVAVIAGRFGATTAAAHQVALSLASFTFMGAQGVSGAAAVRVGNAVGAGRSPRRAGLASIAVGVAVMGVSALAFALVPETLASFFTHDRGVIELAAQLIFIAAVFQLFDGMQVVAAGALRGAGDVRIPFYGMLAAHWLLGFPTAMVLAFPLGWGVRGLWVGLTTGLVSVSILLVLRFHRLTLRPIASLKP